MSIIEITSMSTKGQVVIPATMRKKLHIKGGTKLMVIQEGGNILLKPISQPEPLEFADIIQLAEEIQQELEISDRDINSAIRASRESRASRH